MKRSLLAILALMLVVAPLSGCNGGGGDDYDPNKIAVKQEGSGPPPINQPMGDGAQTKTTG